MEEYNITDYGIFNDAVNTIKEFNSKVESFETSLNECKTVVENDAVFMGPAADECKNSINKINTNVTTMKESLSTISSAIVEIATKYKNGDTDASSSILSVGDSSTDTTGSIKLKDGNVIDTSTPVTTGNKYNLSDEDLKYLAYVACREQGSVEGAKIELSLMANLYEKNKSKYKNVRDYVDNSGWFASGSRKGYKYPGDSYYNAAKEVLNDGNRYLTSNVVEHDCISDITSSSTGSKKDKSSYVAGKTVLTNRYGAKYVFVGFAPNGGDPFGYLV